MRDFTCHKRVKAARITEISEASDGKTVYRLDDEDVSAPHPGTTTYRPVVGDYFVDYEDGYRSISPKAAFEAGYSELGTVSATLAAAEALAAAGEALGDNPPKPTEAEFERIDSINRRFEAIHDAMGRMLGGAE